METRILALNGGDVQAHRSLRDFTSFFDRFEYDDPDQPLYTILGWNARTELDWEKLGVDPLPPGAPIYTQRLHWFKQRYSSHAAYLAAPAGRKRPLEAADDGFHPAAAMARSSMYAAWPKGHDAAQRAGARAREHHLDGIRYMATAPLLYRDEQFDEIRASVARILTAFRKGGDGGAIQPDPLWDENIIAVGRYASPVDGVAPWVPVEDLSEQELVAVWKNAALQSKDLRTLDELFAKVARCSLMYDNLEMSDVGEQGATHAERVRSGNAVNRHTQFQKMIPEGAVALDSLYRVRANPLLRTSYADHTPIVHRS